MEIGLRAKFGCGSHLDQRLRFVEQLVGDLVFVKTEIDPRESHQQPAAQSGGVAQLRREVRPAVVQHRADGCLATQRLSRIGGLEHVGEELRDLIGAIALLSCAVAFGLHVAQLRRQCRDECDHHHRVRRVRIQLSSAFPLQELFFTAALRLRPG